MAGSVALGISDLSVAPGTHMCGLFQGVAEREALELAFVRQGLDAGDKCICVLDNSDRGAFLDALGEHVDVAAVLASDQLALSSTSDVIFGRGPLSSTEMIEFWGELIRLALGSGRFSFARSVGEVTPTLRQILGVEDLMVYETLLNTFIPKHPQILLCLYDLDHVSGGLLVELVKTHATVLMGGTILENRYFLPPDEFLTR
jgi:hypothetical protein